MLSAPPSPQFTQSVLANLAYWQQKCATGQAEVGRLANDFSNLLRALQFGLGLPATQTATAHLMLAANNIVEANGHYAPWLNFLKKALEACDPSDGELQYLLLDNIGKLYLRLHDLPTALAWHQRAAAVAAPLPNRVALGRVYFSLCEDYQALHQYEPALHYSRQAYEILTAHGSPIQQAVVTSQLGEMLRLRQELTEAEALLRTALTLWPADHQYPAEIATNYTRLAQTLTELGRRAEAEACYQTARPLLEQAGSFTGLMSFDLYYGSFLFSGQQYAAAEAVFRALETRLRTLPVPVFQAMTYNNLGNALLGLRRLPEAEAYLREAQALHGSLHAEVMQGTTLCTLGEVLARQGRTAEALETYATALALLVRYPDDAFAGRMVRKYTQHRDLVAAGRSLDEYVATA